MEHNKPHMIKSIREHIRHASCAPPLDKLLIRTDDDILNIGLADGQFAKKLADRIPEGTLLGIDIVDKALARFKEKTKSHGNIKTIKMDVNLMTFKNEFDIVTSLWTLQALNFSLKFYRKVYDALRPGGQMLLVHPSTNNPWVGTYLQIKESGDFPELKNFVSPIHFEMLNKVDETLAAIPFKFLNIERPLISFNLPNIEAFQQFATDVSFFFKPQLSDHLINKIIDAQVELFDTVCKQNHNGKYIYEYSPYIITATK